MADQKKIISWFIKNHENIGLKVNKVGWPQKWWPEISDYEVRTCIGGVTGIGRGVDLNSETAFLKSCVESVERFICATKNIDSNGLALHSDKIISQENAKRELLEREVVKALYTKKLALSDLSHDDLGLESLKLKLSNNNSQLILKKVTLGDLAIILSCIVAADNKPHKELFLGFSFGEDITKAAMKAVSESMVNFTAISESSEINTQDISEVSFNGFKPYYSKTNEVSEVLNYLNKTNTNNQTYTVNESDIIFTDFSMSESVFDGLNLFGIKANFKDKLVLTSRFSDEVTYV